MPSPKARTDRSVGSISQGITILKPAEEFTRADYDHLIAINLTSVYFACAEVGRHMLQRGSGSIVNIASLQPRTAASSSARYLHRQQARRCWR